jgi:hypothetical protein
LTKQIAPLIFIFICTSVGWMILGGTIASRTSASSQQLASHVASIWGTPQEQSPPTATWTQTQSNGLMLDYAMPIESSRIQVALQLDPRQKGLLWYSTYVVDFDGNYIFRNDTPQPQLVTFRFRFPADKAVYDGLAMQVDGKPAATLMDEQGTYTRAEILPGQSGMLRVKYRSHGLGAWRYKLGDKVVQAHDFLLSMQTNFREVDFADDTLAPTSKKATANGWELAWEYADLVSGVQIGLTMPDKLQPGPLAGEISYAAPVSLFFFFFLMYVVTTLRNIELHPINYFFLATGFFAFHLLLAYLVDHVSIHAAMVVSSAISLALVVSYLRLVAGLRFALVEAGLAQLVYLVLFSYAFFWKGFTGLSITVMAILTLFVVMQATGRIRWSERLAAQSGGARAQV